MNVVFLFSDISNIQVFCQSSRVILHDAAVKPYLLEFTKLNVPDPAPMYGRNVFEELSPSF